ncbi:hypothetical protein K3723_05550 [Leisingera caerulea]|uniref:hypothetical protein n=1 Tax=Leisingera caerulea TaxID=506591 RepID=UPI0021A6FDEA|nr:hypothetical protein [Leisingera caerulea]UWQ63754.1 hypothetical protein K3723_05550 [Leisingera caerulea]
MVVQDLRICCHLASVIRETLGEAAHTPARAAEGKSSFSGKVPFFGAMPGVNQKNIWNATRNFCAQE